MNIYITAKQIGKRGNQVAACPYELPGVPGTLRRLIAMLVEQSVDAYNRRILAKAANPVLTGEEMEDMSLVGKIGFGIPYASREADLGEALETAFQGFEDGLYRVFLEDMELESLDAPLVLRENQTLTILRLVMLTGGYF